MKRLQAFFQSLCTLPVLVIFGLAVIVRYLYNITVARGYFPLHDSLTYQTIAYNIMQNHCYCLFPNQPTVDRAPLWPAIIAAVYTLLGERDLAVRLLLCIIGSATCILIYAFVRDLFNKRIATIAGILAAIYPYLFMYDGWLYSESLYTFLLLAFVYTIYRTLKDPHWSLMVLSGIIIALLSLTRPNGLLMLALFLVWAGVMVWQRSLTWQHAIKQALIVSCVALALILPWTIRNYLVTRSFVPVAVGDGKVLLGAYNDMILQRDFYLGIWILPNEATPQIANQFPKDCSGPCEIRREQTYKNEAAHWAQQNINHMPYLLGLHAINLWQIDTKEADLGITRFPDLLASQFVVIWLRIITPIIFALALGGLIFTLRRWRELFYFYLVIVATIAQSIYFYGIPRFRAPIEPMLIILGAGALFWLEQRLQRRRTLNTSVSETQREPVTAGNR